MASAIIKLRVPIAELKRWRGAAGDNLSGWIRSCCAGALDTPEVPVTKPKAVVRVVPTPEPVILAYTDFKTAFEAIQDEHAARVSVAGLTLEEINRSLDARRAAPVDLSKILP